MTVVVRAAWVVLLGSSILAIACSSASGNGSTSTSGSGGGASSTSAAGGASSSSGSTGSGMTSPGYMPFALSSCDDGALGAPATGPDALADAINVVYSDTERLDGVGKSCKCTAKTGHDSFGGQFRTTGMDVGNGDDIWIREALFFPKGFCFGYGTTPDDGWGALKWNRIEFANSPDPGNTPGDRLTLELGNMAAQACNDTGSLWGAAREYAGNANCQPATMGTITAGSWHMVQWQVHLAGDPSGFIRFWIDDQFLGEWSGQTLPPDLPKIDFIQYGDYWNGSPYQDVEWYIDDIIMTKQTPDTKDAAGHPYIAPTARVADWK